MATEWGGVTAGGEGPLLGAEWGRGHCGGRSEVGVTIGDRVRWGLPLGTE